MGIKKNGGKKRKEMQLIDGYMIHGGFRGMVHNIRFDIKRNKMVYLLLIPILAWFIIFCYIPMGGLLMAFQRYSPIKGIMGSEWVGLKNFASFFGGPYFFRIIKNTVILGVLDLVVNFPAPIIFALLLNEITKKKFKKFVQTASYMPYFISSVVVCGLIVNFTQSGGVISEFVASLTGGSSVNLLSEPAAFRPIYILSGMWQGLGYGSIIYLASLSSIDQELYDAAIVDGANRWKQTIHITIPGIMPTVILLLIMRMGSIFAAGGDKILLLYSPATYEVSDVISSYIYRIGIQNYDYGLSTAVGLFNSIIGTIMLLTANGISRKVSETSMF